MHTQIPQSSYTPLCFGTFSGGEGDCTALGMYVLLLEDAILLHAQLLKFDPPRM
ncbi:hypothetical protein Tco_1290250, partial [Tanacetum coccineum]